jgi:hypothetical protein
MATELYKWCVIPVLSIGLFINGKKNTGLHAASDPAVHPLHIATVEIEHNAADKTLEITCKTFWDDFETVLAKLNKTKVDLTNDKDKENKNKWIFNYINSHLQLNIDGKIVPLSFVGFEKEDVVIYSYLQADNIASVKKVSVTNSLMQDMFDDQTEIIHVIVNGNRKSTKLDYPSKTAEFSF